MAWLFTQDHFCSLINKLLVRNWSLSYHDDDILLPERNSSNHDDEMQLQILSVNLLQDHFVVWSTNFPFWNSKYYKPRWWDTILRPECDSFLQYHICSMLNEFPVWNLKLSKPWWWDTILRPKRDFCETLFRSELVSLFLPIMMCPIGIMRLCNGFQSLTYVSIGVLTSVHALEK